VRTIWLTSRSFVPSSPLSVAWREAPIYSAREGAALAWTEAVTRVTDGPIADALYEEVRRHFSGKEIADLTLVVIAINGWNRLAMSFQAPVGNYRPRAARERATAAP